MMYNENDIKNLEEIREFLEKNDIEYTTIYDNFCLNFGTDKRLYEIEYVPARLYPMEHKKFGIPGVPEDYFFKLSYKAEHEDYSFKCWVKDFEWENERKREVLKSYWLYAAGKIKNRFYARECEVRVVPTKEAREFESKHCFYGKRGASLSLGLYTKKSKYGIPKGTLIMLYTFGLNFFGRDDSIEVLRVGTRRRCLVNGGASKLLKHFITNYEYLKIGKREIPVQRIKFYSDYDHNLGQSLEKIGFTFKGYSKSGFMNYWLETGEVKHREPNRHKWVMEQMKKGKVISIPNAGVKTFVLEVDREKYPLKKKKKIQIFKPKK